MTPGLFLQLTDTCLKLDTIPAYFAAAFAKKLSRLALSAPPSGALVVIALIHNLLRRHPSINHLVHRVSSCRVGVSMSQISTRFSVWHPHVDNLMVAFVALLKPSKFFGEFFSLILGSYVHAKIL